MLRVIGLLAAGLVLASCAGATGSSALPAASTAAASPSNVIPTEPSESEVAADLVGTWTRTQDCEGMLAAFEAAGIVESESGWIVGNWVPEGTQPDPNDLCAEAKPAEEHSHFFTADGQFGSLDAEGNQVDDNQYAVADEDTIAFPGSGFHYFQDVLVDYAVSGDEATFKVQWPSGECADECLEAHAWALSAFYAGDPWLRSD